MAFDITATIYVLKKDPDVGIKTIREVVEILSKDFHTTILSEIELPDSIPHIVLDKAFEETFSFPVDIRFFFSDIPKKKLNSTSSKNIIYNNTPNWLDNLKGKTEEIKWSVSKRLSCLGITKSVSVSFISKTLSSKLHSLVMDTIRRGYHSRAYLMDGIAYQFDSNVENVLRSDVIVSYNLVDTSIFDYGKPVILVINDIEELKKLSPTERLCLIKTGIIHSVFTGLVEIRDFFEEFGIESYVLSNTDISFEMFSEYIKRSFLEFHPKEEAFLKSDHKFVDNRGEELVIPSDLSRSFDQLIVPTIERGFKGGSIEETWKYNSLLESTRLLSSQKIVYIGDNYKFVKRLKEENEVIYVFASETKSSRKHDLVIDQIDGLVDFKDHYVICDNIFDNDGYFHCLGFLWLLKKIGFKYLSVSFVRKNTLFLSSNRESYFLNKLGWRINCNGFESVVPDDKMSIIHLISD
jgi:hypothetical protein